MIVDGEDGMIKLLHPKYESYNSDDFYVGFKFRNPLFCKRLLDAFALIYEKGNVDNRISFVKKTF
jgi:hypothetical protein